MPSELIEFHGMPAVRWGIPGGASATATMQGAHLVSWTLPAGEECLFVSERSPFEAGRAIRGGIPVVFPQFADRGPLAQHGFARTRDWTFIDAVDTADGSRARFRLESSDETLALWPSRFRLELSTTISGTRLDVQLQVVNTGEASMSFMAALHTYLRVSDAAKLRLGGLRGMTYLERGSSERKVEAREQVTADEPIDRIYFVAPPATRLEDGQRVVRIVQRNFSDTVVWNPGRERTARMVDMAPDGFRRMLCVEAAAIEPPVVLAPGATWLASQSIERE